MVAVDASEATLLPSASVISPSIMVLSFLPFPATSASMSTRPSIDVCMVMSSMCTFGRAKSSTSRDMPDSDQSSFVSNSKPLGRVSTLTASVCVWPGCANRVMSNVCRLYELLKEPASCPST